MLLKTARSPAELAEYRDLQQSYTSFADNLDWLAANAGKTVTGGANGAPAADAASGKQNTSTRRRSCVSRRRRDPQLEYDSDAAAARAVRSRDQHSGRRERAAEGRACPVPARSQGRRAAPAARPEQLLSAKLRRADRSIVIKGTWHVAQILDRAESRLVHRMMLTAPRGQYEVAGSCRSPIATPAIRPTGSRAMKSTRAHCPGERPTASRVTEMAL